MPLYGSSRRSSNTSSMPQKIRSTLLSTFSFEPSSSLSLSSCTAGSRSPTAVWNVASVPRSASPVEERTNTMFEQQRSSSKWAAGHSTRTNSLTGQELAAEETTTATATTRSSSRSRRRRNSLESSTTTAGAAQQQEQQQQQQLLLSSSVHSTQSEQQQRRYYNRGGGGTSSTLHRRQRRRHSALEGTVAVTAAQREEPLQQQQSSSLLHSSTQSSDDTRQRRRHSALEGGAMQQQRKEEEHQHHHQGGGGSHLQQQQSSTHHSTTQSENRHRRRHAPRHSSLDRAVSPHQQQPELVFHYNSPLDLSSSNHSTRSTQSERPTTTSSSRHRRRRSSLDTGSGGGSAHRHDALDFSSTHSTRSTQSERPTSRHRRRRSSLDTGGGSSAHCHHPHRSCSEEEEEDALDFSSTHSARSTQSERPTTSSSHHRRRRSSLDTGGGAHQSCSEEEEEDVLDFSSTARSPTNKVSIPQRQQDASCSSTSLLYHSPIKTNSNRRAVATSTPCWTNISGGGKVTATLQQKQQQQPLPAKKLYPKSPLPAKTKKMNKLPLAVSNGRIASPWTEAPRQRIVPTQLVAAAPFVAEDDEDTTDISKDKSSKQNQQLLPSPTSSLVFHHDPNQKRLSFSVAPGSAPACPLVSMDIDDDDEEEESEQIPRSVIGWKQPPRSILLSPHRVRNTIRRVHFATSRRQQQRQHRRYSSPPRKPQRRRLPQSDEQKSAILLQAVIRGWIQRRNKLRLQHLLLQHRLDRIEQTRKDQLASIQQAKWAAMERLRTDINDEEQQRLTSKLRLGEQLQDRMKMDNAHVADQTKKLKDHSRTLARSNAALKANAQACHTTFEHMCASVEATQTAQERIESERRSVRRELQRTRKDIQETEHKIQAERLVKEKTMAAVDSIVQLLCCRYDDDALVQRVDKFLSQLDRQLTVQSAPQELRHPAKDTITPEVSPTSHDSSILLDTTNQPHPRKSRRRSS